MKRLVRFLAVLCVAFAATAAPAPKFQLESLTITDWAAPGATITRKFWFTTRDPKITSIRAVVSDLRDSATGRVIDAARITSADATITPGLPTALSIAISGVERSGTYAGSVDLYSVAAKKEHLGRVPILLTARLKPSLGTPPSIAYDFVKCTVCPVTDWFLPDVQHDPKAPRVIHIPKQNQAPLKILGAEVVGRAAANGTQIPRHSVVITPAQMQDGTAVLSIPIDVRFAVLDPDRYSGTIYLALENIDAPVAIPFEINVRHGAFAALLTLIAGILFGWLVSYMERVGNKQAEYLIRLGNSERRLSGRDALALEGDMTEIRQRIDNRLLDGLDKEIESLEIRSLRLREITEYGRELSDNDPLKTTIEEARTLLWNNDATAEAKVKEIRAAFASRGKAAMQANAASFRRGDAALPVSFSLRTIGARLTPYIRPALRIVLLIALAIIGMYAVYVANASFGARRLNDYFTLFLWGVASDVASKTLSSAGTLLPKR